jgi:peptidoglycan pentaglycine glycine transferase (the first glycine)
MPLQIFADLPRKQWNDFVDASPTGSFLQRWEWGEVQKALGFSMWRLAVMEGTTVRAVALVAKRALPLGRSWLYLPGGPVLGEYPQAWGMIQDELKKLTHHESALFVRADPLWLDTKEAVARLGSRWEKAAREVQPRHTIVLDLTRSEEELLAAMHHKTRYNIRLAEKKGVTIHFSTQTTDLEAFLKLAGEVSGRSGFHYHPDAHYRALLNVLGEAGMLELAVALYNDTPVAVNMMVYAGSTATYVHGASGSTHRDVMAPYLLHWQAMQRAKARGSSRYDLFGVAPADAPASHPWKGITRFKEGFGGQRESYVGAHDWVIDRWWYMAYNVAHSVL